MLTTDWNMLAHTHRAHTHTHEHTHTPTLQNVLPGSHLSSQFLFPLCTTWPLEQERQSIEWRKWRCHLPWWLEAWEEWSELDLVLAQTHALWLQSFSVGPVWWRGKIQVLKFWASDFEIGRCWHSTIAKKIFQQHKCVWRCIQSTFAKDQAKLLLTRKYWREKLSH